MKNEMILETFLADLDGGVFEAKLLASLKETALRVVDTGKKGKITIELGISRISESVSQQFKKMLTDGIPGIPAYVGIFSK